MVPLGVNVDPCLLTQVLGQARAASVELGKKPRFSKSFPGRVSIMKHAVNNFSSNLLEKKGLFYEMPE